MTSIFSFVPSVSGAVSAASGVIQNGIGSSVSSALGGLSGLPSAAAGALSSGINGVVGGLTHQFSGLLGQSGPTGAQNNSQSLMKDFLVDIQSYGVAWNNRFYCSFVPPPMMQELIDAGGLSDHKSIATVSDQQHLMMRTDMAELPGYTFTTSDVKTYAPIMRMPNQIIYQDLNLSFMVSADMVEKYFFDYWMYLMRDPNNLYEYYDNFVTDLQITIYAMNNQPIYGVVFHECWPVAMMPIQLSWQDQENMRLSVSFAYRSWETVSYSEPDISAPIPSDPGAKTHSVLTDFFFNMLPSIPGGGKFLAVAGMSTSQLLRAGVSIIGNKSQTKDPISNALISSGTNSINKFLGGG